MKLELSHISYRYDVPLLQDFSVALQQGEFAFLLGRNGSGKSTLLKLINGMLPMQEGTIKLDGIALDSYSRRRRAALVGIVLQGTPPVLEYTVREVAMLGRTPLLSALSGPTAEDEAFVDSALEKMGLLTMANRPANCLSGGEYQRLKVAALLALNSPVLLLDEPFSAQDPLQAEHLAEILQELCPRKIILVVSHQLELARKYATRLLLLKNGGLLADDSPAKILSHSDFARKFY